MFASDGHAILPTHALFGASFVSQLHGEFALVLVDLERNEIILSGDAFLTKPLWYAVWKDWSGAHKFVAASAKSALFGLGAPLSACTLATPNQAVVLTVPTFTVISREPVVRWDLRQHKNHTDDWIAAFLKAVRIRSRRASLNQRGLMYVSMSSGFDSGAIGLALHLQGTSYAGYSFAEPENDEDVAVVSERARLNAQLGGTTHMLVRNNTAFAAEQVWMRQHAEPYVDGGSLLYHGKTVFYIATIARLASQSGRRVHISGQGCDEIISDYARDGKYVNPTLGRGGTACGCFHGIFPANLSANNFFPWCSFYGACQRRGLLKEEYAAGAHAIEARYPFLDVNVVQEFLWLSREVKNSEYKRPVADFLRKHMWPNMWGKKAGFGTGKLPGPSAHIRNADKKYFGHLVRGG